MKLILKIGYQSFLVDTQNCNLAAIVTVIENLKPVQADWHGGVTSYVPDPSCVISIETPIHAAVFCSEKTIDRAATVEELAKDIVEESF